jgi:hypothetical protein
MRTFLDDLRTAGRALRRAPGYSLVVLASLALGLGAAMAAFAIADAVRLRALPFPNGDRLVVLAEVPADGAGLPACGARCDVSYTTFAEVLRRHPFRTVDALIGFTSGGKVYMAGGAPLPVSGGVLTPEAFTLLGVTPLLGRALQAQDDQLGVPLVTVLAHDFWTNQLGADPGVLGRAIKLSDSQYTVVGVMPPGFDFESGSKFWLPAVPTLDPSTRPSIRSLSVIARLAPGHTLRDLAVELSRLEVPDQRGASGPTRMRVAAAPLRDRYVAATQSYDLVFGGLVACLLALVVANLSNLALVRALDQQREVAVRAALGASRWQRVLVTVQVAIAFALVSAGVLLRTSSLALRTVPLGFDAERVVQGTPSFPHPCGVPGMYLPVTERILAELSSLPGVRSAAARTIVPRPGASFTVDGGAPLDGRVAPKVEVGVTPGYFSELGVQLLRGRDFSSADVAGGAPVAIVNTLAAERWWPGADPIGRTIRIDTIAGAGTTATIVGVVSDHRAATATSLTETLGPELYRPWTQASNAFPSFVASGQGDAGSLLLPLRNLLVRHVPDRPVGTARAIDGIAQQWSGMQTNATQAGWIALAGLAIAWLGLHGIAAYGVRRRSREIGIRGAIGAPRWHIVRLVVADIAQWGALGIAVGVPLALAGSRLLASLLYEARVTDPLVLVTVAGLLVTATIGATVVPLRRALAIPALEACRSDEPGDKQLDRCPLRADGDYGFVNCR